MTRDAQAPAARSRHGGRRVEQGRCPPRNCSGLLSRWPAISRARRRASGIVPPRASATGADRGSVRRGPHAGGRGRDAKRPNSSLRRRAENRRDCGHCHHQRLHGSDHADTRPPSRRATELHHRHRISGNGSRSQPDPEWPDDRRDPGEAPVLSPVPRRHAHRAGRPCRATRFRLTRPPNG